MVPDPDGSSHVFFLPDTTAQASGSTLRVGIAEEPRTLNVWMATDANSNKILSLIYQPLYTEHPETLELTPWLAKAMPVWDKETNTYTMELREAKWSDGSPVTAEDVVFTVNTIKSFNVPKYHSKWEFVEKAEAVDTRTFSGWVSMVEGIGNIWSLPNSAAEPLVQIQGLKKTYSEHRSLFARSSPVGKERSPQAKSGPDS
ncbi:MAG: ABC transporter substrate-binding protein [Desulfosalsimonas sp.]|uniref:ABC transporter substrate-binding protein n=1 Tax=Desulfosalsimonas sp. TaxID=3073848 RepID=UPI0039706285